MYMNICVCVEDNMGMSFCRRRLSRDRVMIERLCSHDEYEHIYISKYSAPLFGDTGDERVRVTEDFSEAGERDLCFFELEHITEYADRVGCIIFYRWNRRYPSDKKFPFLPEAHGYKLKSTFEFAGSSHDKITEEVWTR